MTRPFRSQNEKAKFRPGGVDPLDAQLEAALGGLSEDELYGFNKPAPAEAGEDKTTRRGKVVSIGKDDLFVDFGGKSQGIASLVQFEEIPSVGEELEFHVERYDPREGLLILTRKGALATNVSWETLEIGQVVEGTVTGVNKGGLEIDVKGMRAFMPAGQVEIYHVPDLSQFLNQRLSAEVTQVERQGRNIVLSRRNILEREREEKKKQLLAELAPEQIRRGTVRSIMDFGAFVDLGGVDGLLHVSELAFRKVRNAGEVVKVGEVLDVKVLKVDHETGKVSLSLKQARGTDPWAAAEERYAAGAAVTGRVTRIESFGVFIEVEEGIEGLLHISEMSHNHVRHPGDLVKVSDTIRLVVLSVDPVARKLSFSRKQAQAEEAAEAAAAAAPGPVKKRNRQELRGGLDF
ncbi:MAG TPA: S1 RNA-binding domain-containing protein [Tepidisphaeraceae bacterium]|nr:S1 RNA-binding domain-containing protein [Tepidisphaeraceae bacterium]